MTIDPKLIEDKLGILVGKDIQLISRAGNMFCMWFGPEVEYTTHKGEVQHGGNHILHVECIWRLTSPEGIVVGFNDFYTPSPKLSDEDCRTADLDEVGNNKFDYISDSLMKEIGAGTVHVTGIHADKYGGFSLSFDNGWKLDVFPDDAEDDEHWRFFERAEGSKHFIVFDTEEQT